MTISVKSIDVRMPKMIASCERQSEVAGRLNSDVPFALALDSTLC